MPLTELLPPSTLPWAICMRRLLACGSGSVSYGQLFLAMIFATPAGILINRLLSSPPASSSSTRAWVRRISCAASTQPAEPAPTIM
ncbi:Uncharacterised protein [Serratia ficaria]|nr:Uncharacterised protein [Serratia ficaria]